VPQFSISGAVMGGAPLGISIIGAPGSARDPWAVARAFAA
jgi:hypothetical protein